MHHTDQVSKESKKSKNQVSKKSKKTRLVKQVRKLKHALCVGLPVTGHSLPSAWQSSACGESLGTPAWLHPQHPPNIHLAQLKYYWLRGRTSVNSLFWANSGQSQMTHCMISNIV